MSQNTISIKLLLYFIDSNFRVKILNINNIERFKRKIDV